MDIGRLVVISGQDQEKTFLLKNLSVFEAGRAAGSHILITDPSVAFNHFRIHRSGSSYSLHDLGSRSGTLVNGSPAEIAELGEGDVIQAGDVEFRFDLVDAETPGKVASCAPEFDLARDPANGVGEKAIVSHGTTAYLRVIEGDEKGKSYRLIGKGRFVIGRSTKCDLRLKDGKISRCHCVIEKVGDHFVMSDQGSANGTVVNGEPIKKTVLKEGDYVRLGYSILKFGWS